MGATVSTRHGKKKTYFVTVHRGGEKAFSATFKTKREAEDLKRDILKQEILGVNVLEGLRKARVVEVKPDAVAYPTLRTAATEFIESMMNRGTWRESTGV